MTEKLEEKLTLSSRKRRIGAFIIDHFTMTFLIVGIVFLSLEESVSILPFHIVFCKLIPKF